MKMSSVLKAADSLVVIFLPPFVSLSKSEEAGLRGSQELRAIVAAVVNAVT